MHRLYAISTLTLTLRHEAVEKKLNEAIGGDWIRFSYNQWFIWTDKTVMDITLAVRSALAPPEQCVISVVHPEAANGNAPPWIWNWLNERMQKQFRGET